MTHSYLKSTLALATLIALPTLSWAGTTTKAPAAATPVEKINSSAITGDIGLSVYTTMYSRGSILFKENPTILPYIDLFGTVYEGDGFLNKAVLSLNITEYYGHKKIPGNLTNNSHWYENDIIPALALTFGKVTITEGYHNYTTPNGGGTFEGLNSSIGFDDGDLLGAFALHPSFTYMQRNNSHGQYYEVAVGPGFSAGDVSVSFPAAIGFGEDGFYGTALDPVTGKPTTKDGFAYFSLGTSVSYALPMPKTYGVWKLTAGVTYYHKDINVTEHASAVNVSKTAPVKNDDVSASAGIVINF
jgi:hypothetical protein